jgi:hypothetical protein
LKKGGTVQTRRAGEANRYAAQRLEKLGLGAYKAEKQLVSLLKMDQP